MNKINATVWIYEYEWSEGLLACELCTYSKTQVESYSPQGEENLPSGIHLLRIFKFKIYIPELNYVDNQC